MPKGSVTEKLYSQPPCSTYVHIGRCSSHSKQRLIHKDHMDARASLCPRIPKSSNVFAPNGPYPQDVTAAQFTRVHFTQPGRRWQYHARFGETPCGVAAGEGGT